ncbi:hypothetical protein [Candidatus Poriferisodalis sp.]|uniref:hypothetical protein n=1 Tax=Candidatus Poriferisodalis sp. TaxID=3101277 RepID=UPI003B5B2BA3
MQFGIGQSQRSSTPTPSFRVIFQRCLHGPVILTADRGVASWGEVFDDTAGAAAMGGLARAPKRRADIAGDRYCMRVHRARAHRLTEGGNTPNHTPIRVEHVNEQP